MNDQDRDLILAVAAGALGEAETAAAMARIQADPELTEERKRKVLGLNAAKLYGIDPCERRDQIDLSQLGLAKAGIDEEMGSRRWVFNEPLGPTTRREFLAMARRNLAEGRPG